MLKAELDCFFLDKMDTGSPLDFYQLVKSSDFSISIN